MIVGRPVTSMMEERVQRIGRELIEQADRRGPFPLSPGWFDRQMLEWASADEATKVQLFRFVDVLPMLKEPADVASHFHEYFPTDLARTPWPIRLASYWARPESPIRKVVGRVIRAGTVRMARRFVAGTTPAEIAAATRSLWKRGLAFTIDVLGEATVTEREADLYRDEYLALLEHLANEVATWPGNPRLDRDDRGAIPRLNLSIKVSALDSRFHPDDPAGTTERVSSRLREILRSARRHDAHVNIDMEQYAYKEVTLAIVRRILMEPEFRDWPDVGLAMQAYLRETERDLVAMADWARSRGTPIVVRLVKGAYWDYETITATHRHWPVPVFTEKWESDASFERCSVFLLEHADLLRPAIASHNLRSIAHALAVAEQLRLDRSAYEIQMLHGMADPFCKVFERRGERVRVYTPFGKLLPGMAYLVRRLIENSSNSSFVRQALTRIEPPEFLLAPPARPALARKPKETATMIASLPHRGESITIANEPVRDFSLRTARDEMAQALIDVRRQLGRHVDLWIDGRFLGTDETIESVNPAQFREVVGTSASANVAHADQAVAGARRAFELWKRVPVAERAARVQSLAGALRRQRLELAAWEVYECGKSWREADADVCEAIDFCDYYSRQMLDLGTPRRRSDPGETHEYHYLPRGVVAVIAPWNFPLAILCGMTVAPLVAGNSVIVKPAEQSPIIAGRFVELIAETMDLPPGTVQFLPGVGEVAGVRLVEHPDVAVINFTGSRAVGLAIVEAAARTRPGQMGVKQVLAEMGGKNALIVDRDADLDEAVLGVVASAFGFQGQKCSACSRVIVHKAVRDPFVDRLVEATAGLSMGPPTDPAFDLGPVIDAEARDRLLGVIEQGKREARCLHAGAAGSLAETGYYVGPHVFDQVAPDHRLARDEFFGPILTILEASDLSEAIAIANGTDYALTGGIYSRSPHSIAQARAEFDVGNLYVNRKITGAEVDRQPFGGHRFSGTGSKAGGPDYLRHFLWGRTITENTLRRGFAPESDQEAGPIGSS